MKQIYIYVIAIISLCACNTDVALDKDKTPLVQVGENILYYEDIEHLFETRALTSDSTKFVQSYIEKWSTDQLLYQLAIDNISSSEEIEVLVEEYRKALFIYKYQQQYVETNIKMPSKKQIKQYYDDNQALFVQKEPLLRGIFISFPHKLAGGKEIKRMLKRYQPRNIDKIEKFSFENAASYDYFMDNWVVGTSVADKLPQGADFIGALKSDKQFYEYTDSAMAYVLFADSIVNIGDISPFEYVENSAKEMLYNKIKMNYIQELAPQLYHDALSSGTIKRFSNTADTTTISR